VASSASVYKPTLTPKNGDWGGRCLGVYVQTPAGIPAAHAWTTLTWDTLAAAAAAMWSTVAVTTAAAVAMALACSLDQASKAILLATATLTYTTTTTTTTV